MHHSFQKQQRSYQQQQSRHYPLLIYYFLLQQEQHQSVPQDPLFSSLLEVKHDPNKGLIYIENQQLRRKDITSVKDALNGYQKGKCFYSFKDISIRRGDYNICDVDHFLPHKHKKEHLEQGANLDGIWNLVLADQRINRQKSDLVPDEKYLTRLYKRNETYIDSKHPLAETIINQTGSTKAKRISFLQKHYNISKGNSIHTWRPDEELTGNF